VDYRVSFAPAVYGQKLVVRILDPATAPGALADLRLAKPLEDRLQDSVRQESGMVLVCGPTGSGKTSTLYALLKATDLDELNVVTIEDPVEIQIPGITQIPVDAERGNTFANLLRSVLRQDPDVILVGEIRDAETARIAMQAAITGHLVFSTVHTKDSTGTVFRLLDLGVEPYLLSQGLHVVVAQRLVRQLCPFCKAPRPITEDQARKMGATADGVKHTYVRIGCARCLGTGYAGRRAFFELLTMNDRLRDVVAHAPTPGDILKAVDGTGFETLQHAGYRLVAEGVADFEEVERAVGR
jgi:type II secretory ATPase GspE/PulE/Tfp pilus assembly ATPase PilB-like protein